MKPLLLSVVMLAPWAISAHTVPDDVRVQAFLKPRNGRMTILVRVPANAMIDILFPILPGTDSLDLKQIDGFASAGAQVWIADLLSVYEDGRLLPPPQILAARISSLGDFSFDSFQDALNHMSGDRLPSDALLPQDQAAVDALLEIPIRSANSDFSIEPRFGRLGVRVTTTLAFLPATSAIRQYVYEGDPELFDLNPSWNRAGGLFIKAGFGNGLTQSDDLLFLLCLGLVFKRFRTLLPFLAAFTAAQVCGMMCCAAGFVPAGPGFTAVTATLAAAIVVYTGVEVIVAVERHGMGWPVAVVSGFVFGTNSWSVLNPNIQFGGIHRLFSILAFDLGLTVGQFGVVALIVAAMPFATGFTRAPRTAIVIAAAIAVRVAWHRMIDHAHALGTLATYSAFRSSTIILMACSALAAGFVVATVRNYCGENRFSRRSFR